MLARAALGNPGIGVAYARAVASGMGSKLVVGGSGLAVLWLLNAILGKDGFAHCMIGLTLNQSVAVVLASALEKLVLYHVSRLDDAADEVRSRRIAGAALCGGSVIGLLLASIVFALSDVLAGWMSMPEAGDWIAIFAPVIPLTVMISVQTGWLQARQMVPTSVLFADVVPNSLRVVLIGLAWLLAGSMLGIGGAVCAALLAPVVWLFVLQPTPPVSPFGVFTKWDARYAFTAMFIRLADQRVKSISVLLVGILSTAAVTAEFIVATRFALLLVTLQASMNLLLEPRLGALMARGSGDDLSKEYDLSRFIALLSSIVGTIAYLLFAPFILPLFGDYGGAMPVLTILSAAMLVRVGFGASGSYLMMSGYAGWRLFNSLGSLVVMVAMSFALVPSLGGEGAATAAFVSILFANGLGAIVIWRLDALVTVSARLLAAIGAASAVLLASGFGLVPPEVAAACLSLVAAWIMFCYRRTWRPWLERMLGRKSAA